MTPQEPSFTLKLHFLALLAGICAFGTRAADVPEPAQFISEVIPIKYEKASDIATALTSMTTKNVGGAVALGGPSEALPPGTPATTNANATSKSCDVLEQRIQHLLRAAAASSEIRDIGQAHIISDDRTNSLLIHATPKDMRTFKEIISRLDHPPREFLIEAVVIDITIGDSKTLSSRLPQRNTERPNNGSLGAGMLSRSNLCFVTDLLPMVDTDSEGSQAIESDHLAKSAKDARVPRKTVKPKASHPAGFAYLAKVGSDLDALVLALAGDCRVRILQRPRIQTSEGEPASLFIGESRPASASYYYGGAAYSSYSAIRQIKAYATLEVTPFAKPDGSLELGIRQVLDRPAGTVVVTNIGEIPITTSSEAQASLTVRNRETLLLGGWNDGPEKDSGSGVPLLKDFPVVGALFRSSSARKPQHELIVLDPAHRPAQRSRHRLAC